MRRAKGIAAAFGVAAALVAGAPAQEVCTTVCSMYEEGNCVEHTQTCVTQPQRPAYGAIAYGRTSRAWGYSDHWDNRAKAESEALKNCAQHGSDCEVMVWYVRQCGAVAAGDGTVAFWGIGDGIGAARGDALGKCTKGGGRNCAIQVAECSR